MNSKFKPLIVLFIAFFKIIPIPILSLGGNDTDISALLSFKSNLHDPLGVLASWNGSTHFCGWQGVTCGRQHRRVTGLNLSSSGLVGPLSPSIGNLSFLREIRLQNNSLHGQIPPQIGRLFRLQSLRLQYNALEGNFPTNLSHCKNLFLLSIGSNRLVGEIPREVGTLAKLITLALYQNNLTGKIPSSIGNLTSLEYLRLDYMFLQGIIPHNLGGLTNLKILGLGGNNLSGEIPSSIYNITSLNLLFLTFNQLEGSLPRDLGLTLPNLQGIDMGNNKISGTIPLNLTNAPELLEIDFTHNKFTGKVPTNFGSLQLLQFFGLEDNLLGSGEGDDMNFLISLANCSELQLFGVEFNQLGGFLPNILGNFSRKLTNFGVAVNQISGVIPPEITNLVNLTTLEFGYNEFEGQIPGNIGELQKLVNLNIASTRVSGQIPSSLGNLSLLSGAFLDNNRLEGTIPSSLGNCRNLLELNLSQNNLSGTIPKELFSASALSVSLDLARNRLIGLVPREIGKLKSLGILDLSENSLSGEIPNELGSCDSLEYLLLNGNLFNGSIPSSFLSLRGIQILDLSSNNLSGKIPMFLENFSLQSLNLSFNDLEGELPAKGIFANSSVVSVDGNYRLCGGIDELGLSKCKRLASRKNKLSRLEIIIISTGCSILGVAIVILFVVCWLKRKKRVLSSGSLLQESFLKVSYGDLLKATNGFSSTNLIGMGSFGSVYKGTLDDNSLIAIKVVNLQREGASRSFDAECEALRNIRHRNLVKVVTSCSSIDFQGNDFKALVYEFMPNGGLDKWLKDEPHKLSLHQIIDIAVDVACAINYLHHQCENTILHCDLKPSNVLLDADMVARVGDFGLAKFLLPDVSIANESTSIGIRGTIGYAPPEYGLGSEVSMNGDVYSYGILLLEMITGKSPTDSMFNEGHNLHNYARTALHDNVMEIVEPKYITIEEEEALFPQVPNMLSARDINKEEECLRLLVKTGVACSMESPQNRMNMNDVTRELNSARRILEES